MVLSVYFELFLRKHVKKMDLKRFEWLLDEAIKFGIQIFLALVILVVGFWLSSKIKNIIRNRMIKRNLDASIREFTLPIISILLKLMVVLSAINAVGIQITSFAAILAGLAAGVGLSLQGSLSNFAGGLLIIIFKPFKVGDYIEALNNSGTVESISILYTTIVNDRQQVVTLPNSSVLNNPVINYSIKENRRLDLKISLSYNEDIDKAQQLIRQMIENEPKILKEEAVTVEISELTDSRVIFVVRAFTKRSDFWETNYKLLKEMKRIFDENEISISSPPADIKIINEKKD